MSRVCCCFWSHVVLTGFSPFSLSRCFSVVVLRCFVGIREACVPVLPCNVCIRMSKCVIQEGEVFLSDIFVLESWGHRTAVGGFCLPLQREVLSWALRARCCSCCRISEEGGGEGRGVCNSVRAVILYSVSAQKRG